MTFCHRYQDQAVLIVMMEDRIVGCILGTAMGDAIGLPYEGLTPHRALKLLGLPDRHRFFFGRGMISDDTEHTCLVAEALIDAQGDLNRFQKSLARRLRWWLAGIPAGIGFATLRAIVRLWMGVPPERSGVSSAGNGPAMRAAILGVAISDIETLRAFVRVSSRITHSDPKAEIGAMGVAIAARFASRTGAISPDAYLSEVQAVAGADWQEFVEATNGIVASVSKGETTESFARGLGLERGVSGYIYHSVPVALHAWLTHPNDFKSAISSVICCGGDTDSTAAIVGGLVGAGIGRSRLPSDWLNGLMEWPRTVHWMERLGQRLDCGNPMERSNRDVLLFGPGILVRNIFFLMIVLSHGFRRLAPPY